MKKFMVLLLTGILLLVSALSVSADLIWDFGFGQDENSPDTVAYADEVTGYSALDDSAAERGFPAGTRFEYVSFIEVKDVLWGECYFSGDDDDSTGSFQLSKSEHAFIEAKYLASKAAYDFWLENRDAVVPNEPDEFDFCANGPFDLYAFPGAETAEFVLNLTEVLCPSDATVKPLIEHSWMFTDASGSRWLSASAVFNDHYSRSSLSGWVNIGPEK